VIIWRTDTWAEATRTKLEGNNYSLCNLAIHPTLSVMAAAGKYQTVIEVWDLDLLLLRGTELAAPTVIYVNAKAVLLGDSGVGKSGLGIRIAEGAFRPTKVRRMAPSSGTSPRSGCPRCRRTSRPS